jgi:hypothetical protein
MYNNTESTVFTARPSSTQSEKLLLYIPATVYGGNTVGLQKPYAKTELGESCTCIDVY